VPDPAADESMTVVWLRRLAVASKPPAIAAATSRLRDMWRMVIVIVLFVFRQPEASSVTTPTRRITIFANDLQLLYKNAIDLRLRRAPATGSAIKTAARARRGGGCLASESGSTQGGG
jgi:hypothetical protein